MGTAQVGALQKDPVDSHAPELHDDRVVFRLPDPDAALAEVNLIQEVMRPRLGPRFETVGTDWQLTFPRPNADRIEYLFHLRHRNTHDACRKPQDIRDETTKGGWRFHWRD